MLMDLRTLAESAVQDSAVYGQKAAWLARCVVAGERVPAGFALTAEQASALVAGDERLAGELASALQRLRDQHPAADLIAVRSSPAQSLPGAMLTRLDVLGTSADVIQAVAEVLASRDNAAARELWQARGEAGPVPMPAVLIQARLAVTQAGDFGAVVFTRDPDRGTRPPVGEYLPGTGPDQVVGGRNLPKPLSARGRASTESLEQVDPAVFQEITALAARLEAHFDEPLELELMRSGGRLWVLQARPLVMSPRALVALAREAIDADSPRFRGFIARLLEAGLAGLLERELPPPAELAAERVRLRGLAASPGVGSGVLVLDTEAAFARAQREAVVLMRTEALPSDVAACRAASALVTTSGGLTSHAAVIARGLRLPAVVGCAQARIDLQQRAVFAPGSAQPIVREGDVVTVDAQRGLVYAGAIATRERIASPELRSLLQELRKLRPIALWAYGPAAQALAAKDEVCLDGILCPVEDPVQLPPARGRECWVELPADRALELLPQIPTGWGVVLRGDPRVIPWAEVRRASRLRPLGFHLTTTDVQALPPGLDLLVVSGDVGAAEEASSTAARTLFIDDFSQIPAGIGHSFNCGLLCETARSLVRALELATVRTFGATPA